MKKKSLLFFLMLTVFFSIVGCEISKDSVSMVVLFKSDVEKYSDFERELKKEKNLSLKIEYLIDDLGEEYFKIEDLWSTIENKLSEKLEDEHVDIIANIPTPYLYNPIENDQLESFDSYIEKGKFDLSKIYKPVINISKKVGNNEIYFLSPSFNSKYFIINNDIFESLDIEIPDKKLTWSDVYSLSLQVESKNKEIKKGIYPISLGPAGKSGLFMDFELLSSIKELPILEGTSDLYHNEEWYSLINQFIKIFQTNGNRDNLDEIDDLFFQGKVAMKVFYPLDFNVLSGKYSSQELGFTPKKFNYTIFPAPVFDKNIDYIEQKNLAISKKSKKKDLAWKTIEFAMSKEYATFMAKSERNAFDGIFTSYKDNEVLDIYSNKYKGINPNIFYSGDEGPIKPEDFTEAKYLYYHELARKYFPLMIDNKLTVREGINIMKSKFNEKF